MENGLQKLGVVRRMELWSERVQECRSSGKSVREWCRDKGLSEKTYYYWQRRLFKTLTESPQQIREPLSAETTVFAQITPPTCCCSDIAVTVHIAGIEADIHSGADAATVETVLRILQSC